MTIGVGCVGRAVGFVAGVFVEFGVGVAAKFVLWLTGED